MASGAQFIFLDEPALGLDANHRELLYKLILERFEETGVFRRFIRFGNTAFALFCVKCGAMA